MTGGMTEGIVGNLLSQGIWEVGKRLLRRISCWRYTQLFGPDAVNGSLHLVYAQLTPPVGVTTDGRLVSHIFSRPGLDDVKFSMSAAISYCEVRALKYLAENVAANTGSWAILASAKEIAAKHDLSFVSFGLISNSKTVEILDSVANPFVRYEHPRFATKVTGRTVIRASQTPAEDFGVIIKIRPSNLPGRTWICCGGFGEWGTSGAAWYLTRRWRDIRSKFGDRPFVVFVRVPTDHDELADSIIEAATPEDLERQARGD
jgi:hypothetical protein